MIKFRALSDEAGSQGFCLLTMELTYNLLFLSWCLFYEGPNPRLYSSHWPINNSTGPMASYCKHRRVEENSPGFTFDWLAS